MKKQKAAGLYVSILLLLAIGIETIASYLVNYKKAEETKNLVFEQEIIIHDLFIIMVSTGKSPN